MITVRIESSEFRNGWLAHKQKVEYRDNPYSRTREAFSLSAWNNGWLYRERLFRQLDERQMLNRDLEMIHNDGVFTAKGV